MRKILNATTCTLDSIKLDCEVIEMDYKHLTNQIHPILDIESDDIYDNDEILEAKALEFLTSIQMYMLNNNIPLDTDVALDILEPFWVKYILQADTHLNIYILIHKKHSNIRKGLVKLSKHKTFKELATTSVRNEAVLKAMIELSKNHPSSKE